MIHHTRRLFILLILMLAAWPVQAQEQAQKQAQTLKAGSTFKDCKTCPEMVVVPSGIYIMGLGSKRKRDGPAHRVNIKRPFAIGRFEVTFREWFACVAEKGCRHKPDDHKWGTIKRPVINITWHQAQNYLKWLSRKTGHKYRLPSEAEWEYVHRGGTTTTFWWGNDVGNKNANCRDCESRRCCTAKDHSCCSHGTQQVGTYKPNPFGIHDTAGNVFEWTADCWNPSHKGASKAAAARTTGDCKNRVIRGGSFYYFNKVARSSYRSKNPPGVKSYWLGFRAVRELP